jgi:hypothetical protein
VAENSEAGLPGPLARAGTATALVRHSANAAMITAQNWPCFDREQSVAEPTEIAASQRELGLGESAGV